jgi:hypothetical protein
MSHAAIAAVLALDGVSAGERLAGFSLASFANREQRAWPGTRVAAARAGLSRSQYLAARDRLARRGLVVLEEPGGGRGRAPTVLLACADTGPWFEGDINAELAQSVLSHSPAQGAARVLLATLAAVADDTGAVEGRSSDEIRRAAGMAASTYRRARANLLTSGEIVLDAAGGGRAITNRWIVLDPTAVNPEPLTAAQRRPGMPDGARPLLATARELLPEPEEQVGLSADAAVAAGQEGNNLGDVEARNPGQDRMVSRPRGPGLSGVSGIYPGQSRTVSELNGPSLTGVSGVNPGQSRSVCGQTPPKTPPETPPPNARTGRESQNPRTSKDPPNPPEGGSREPVLIVEDYLTPRGRQRHRTVTVDLDEIRAQLLSISPADRADWQQIRADLEIAVGGSMFAVWLGALRLIAVDDIGALLLACPAATRQWVAGRYSAAIQRVGQSRGRGVRLASDRELQLLDVLAAAGTEMPCDVPLPHDHQEAV